MALDVRFVRMTDFFYDLKSVFCLKDFNSALYFVCFVWMTANSLAVC